MSDSNKNKKTQKIQPITPQVSEPKEAATTVKFAWLRKGLTWFQEAFFQPSLSRQQQVATAYSEQFTRTLGAVSKRYSANDPKLKDIITDKTLRFSSPLEQPKTPTTPEISTPLVKPTLH